MTTPASSRTNTPLTDSQPKRRFTIHGIDGVRHEEWVDADHARLLETRLAEATEALRECADWLKELADDGDTADWVIKKHRELATKIGAISTTHASPKSGHYVPVTTPVNMKGTRMDWENNRIADDNETTNQK